MDSQTNLKQILRGSQSKGAAKKQSFLSQENNYDFSYTINSSAQAKKPCQPVDFCLRSTFKDAGSKIKPGLAKPAALWQTSTYTSTRAGHRAQFDRDKVASGKKAKKNKNAQRRWNRKRAFAAGRSVEETLGRRVRKLKIIPSKLLLKARTAKSKRPGKPGEPWKKPMSESGGQELKRVTTSKFIFAPQNLCPESSANCAQRRSVNSERAFARRLTTSDAGRGIYLLRRGTDGDSGFEEDRNVYFAREEEAEAAEAKAEARERHSATAGLRRRTPAPEKSEAPRRRAKKGDCKNKTSGNKTFAGKKKFASKIKGIKKELLKMKLRSKEGKKGKGRRRRGPENLQFSNRLLLEKAEFEGLYYSRATPKEPRKLRAAHLRQARRAKRRAKEESRELSRVDSKINNFMNFEREFETKKTRKARAKGGARVSEVESKAQREFVGSASKRQRKSSLMRSNFQVGKNISTGKAQIHKQTFRWKRLQPRPKRPARPQMQLQRAKLVPRKPNPQKRVLNPFLGGKATVKKMRKKCYNMTSIDNTKAGVVMHKFVEPEEGHSHCTAKKLVWTNNQLNSILSSESSKSGLEPSLAEAPESAPQSSQLQRQVHSNLAIIQKKLERKKKLSVFKIARQTPAAKSMSLTQQGHQRKWVTEDFKRNSALSIEGVLPEGRGKAGAPLQMKAAKPKRKHTWTPGGLEKRASVSKKIEENPDKYLYLHDLIGKGSFGEVYLVENLLTHEFYAMKIISKLKIKKREMIEYIWNEKEIMVRLGHPFIAKLHFAFQNDKFLFLLMQYLPGGSLRSLISKGKRRLTEADLKERQIKLYTCQIILALEHLHKFDVVYRDLKSDNIVFDALGHAVLIDFGLAKTNVPDYSSGTDSFCGTLAYLAPEMVLKKGTRARLGKQRRN